MSEIFEIFNDKNERVGTALRSEVHKKGLYHRGAIIFLVNSKGNIFLQKRSENKDTSPGCWDYSTGEHLKPGETFEEAALRGLKEELGVSHPKVRQLRGPKLNSFVHENGAIDKEFDSLFIAETDEAISLDREEISEGRFFTEEEIDQDVKNKRRKFTKFFLTEWPEFKHFRKL